ncbi:NAC domain containing protein [Quillaja saponaria]|uniref:NAC domain containing protein n=1 Tax=Quillaja saponaria TaxID=32244 RepID=A0AAD7PWW2_QUISA|nr:NAC domain containing protein [Quillaja saponaria]
MGGNSANSLAPGFRFHPTDEELVRYYLKRKVSGKSFRFDPISIVDVYKSEPWDLPCKSKLKSRDLEWYFFSILDKKYVNGSKTNRATERGYWKTTGKDRPVHHNSRIVGMKKTLVYHSGRAPRGIRTNWVMHEYKLTDEELEKAGIAQNAFVLCRIFQKSGTGPKNGEQYGAPFVEEEWEDDEVILLPGEEAVTNEVVLDDGAYFEANDLEQSTEVGITLESDHIHLNFFHGETSNCAGHSQVYTEEEQKPMIGTDETSELHNDNLVVPEQYVMEAKLEKHEYVAEPNYNRFPVDSNYYLDELHKDAIDNPQAGDGSFLETNDLMNPIEADSSGFDMLEEYLTFFDAEDDISQYLNFDSYPNTDNENFVSDQATPFAQKPLDEQIECNSMESKHDVGAHVNNDASSSKKNLEVSKVEPDIKYPFLKHASHILGSIPAPPAFASEFPPKDTALRLRSAGQSSNSVHITAGMVKIRDVTFDGMDWAFGKTGDDSFILASGLSEAGANSSGLVPLSGLLPGKTAFMVSHGLVFLMFFWVVILSVSLKIGSFMYTEVNSCLPSITFLQEALYHQVDHKQRHPDKKKLH